MDTADQKIEFTIQGNVALLCINRPEKLNAISRMMLEKFDEYVSKIDQNR